jgi:hypothetical protein
MLEDMDNPLPNHAIGDPLTLPKPATTTRIYFQNVNGINTSTIEGNWELLCTHIRDMEIDIGLFAETKLDTNQPAAMKRLHDTARNVFGQGCYKMEATTTPVPSAGLYKPGGIMALTIGDTIGRIFQGGRDELGRWCHLTYRRSNGPPITIITTYQVCDTEPTTAGPTTYATQLCSLYHRQNRDNPANLRKHHADDLIEFVQACRSRGEWIVVAG